MSRWTRWPRRPGSTGPRRSWADLATIPKEFYSVQEVKLAEEEPLARELQSFLEAVEQKKEPVVPGEHGVRAMRAAEKILTEMRAHRWK